MSSSAPQSASSAHLDAAPVAAIGSRWWKNPWILRILSLVTVLIVWEVTGREMNPVFATYPTAVVRASIELVQSGELWRALEETLIALALGLSVSITIGTLVGFLMGRYRSIEHVLDPYVTALYATPRVALIPLLILWFGIEFKLRLVMVVLSSVFEMIVSVMQGVKNVDRNLLETAIAFNATERQILTKVIAPGSIPFIVVGIRLSITRALVGVIVAEMFASIQGLGGMIVAFGNYFKTAHLFVPIIVVCLISVILTGALKVIEKKVMRWRLD